MMEGLLVTLKVQIFGVFGILVTYHKNKGTFNNNVKRKRNIETDKKRVLK